MGLLRKSITKSVSALLSFILIFSLFTIIPLPVRAEDGAHVLTVDYFEPSLTDDHYENIALETKIDGSSAEGTSHSVQSGANISVTARLKSNDYRFHVTGMTMTYTQDGETKTLDAQLEILDAYRNVRAEFTMPSADARISFSVEEVCSVQVSGSADGTVSADRVRARKGDRVNVTVTPTNDTKPYYKLYASYEWDTETKQVEIDNNSSFVMPADSDVTVYAEFFSAVVTYIERSWNGEKVVEKERIRTPAEGYIKMSDVADGSTLQGGNWYYVDSNVAYNSRIHSDGEVNIILGDGATVDFRRGLEVGENDTLNVYDQKDGTGKLIAFCERFAERDDQDEAAIGADSGNGGNMNFYGGNFEATTKRETRGAAIGGGGFGSAGRLIFYAGNYTVKARFGVSTGIGGGYKGEASRCSGEGITIYGGTFDVQTFQSGAAIGSGEKAYRSTGAIAIYGGSITASSHNGGAAIGGGKNSENGPIYIYGGEINALAYGNKIGAGIGGGQEAEQGAPIYISGGLVISQSDNGAGIGGGMSKGGGYVEISDGLVVATSTAGGAGIGGGKNGSNHIVNITGGYVIAASSSYESSSEMMNMVTKYLAHAPMGSQYQRTANAMMVSVAGLIDLFSSDEELSGAGIGGGHGGSGGEVNIFGGIVIAKSGLSSANAIGKGKSGSDSGTLTLGNKMMVSSGSDDNNAQLKTKDERLSACRSCKFAEVRPCGFSHTNYTVIDEYSHKTTCEYCDADQDVDLHEYDSTGLRCTLCGYERIKVSFDPGNGSGAMDDVYLARGDTFTIPASAFTPPDNKYFSGWRGTIGSSTDVFVPGTSFTLNESVTLTAEYGDTYQLWVGGTQVTDANKNDVLGDGKVSFDPENFVLNLNGVTSLPGINSNLRSLIYANRMNLTITGSGELTPEQMFTNGVYVNIGSLTLNGDFSVVGSQGNGFYASKDIIIAGGTITAQAKSYGIRAGRRLYLYDGITRVSSDAEQQRAMGYDDIYVDPSLLVTEYSPEDALRPDGRFYYNYPRHIKMERGAVVTYELNGGKMNGQTEDVRQVVRKGTVVSRPDDPERDGYAFGGWYKDDGFNSSFDFSEPVNADITLYAKWTEKPRHTISMSDMTGGYVFAPVEAYEGQTVKVYPHEEYGYDIKNISYTTDSGDETEIVGVDYSFSFTMPDDNVTINAIFLGAEYRIGIADSVPAGAVSAPETALAGEKVNVTINDVDDRHLVGVTVKDSEDNDIRYNSEKNTFTMPLSDVTIDAGFEAHAYGTPEWTWEGHSLATAVFRCTVCGHDHTETAEGSAITSEVAAQPTYTTDGECIYTATVTFGGVEYNSTKTETLDKLSREVEVSYIDLNGESQTITATRIIGDETDLENGWYAVMSNVTNNNRISNNGTSQDGVNIILCDGATLTNPEGMSVNGGRSLTVWGQSEGSGTWNITKPPSSCAGIGGYINTSGNITINGGVINVTGEEYGAGIGTGAFVFDNQGVITVNGGTVNAKGGYGGAGIGSGRGNNNYGGRVVINGGTVTATGGTNAAGIGAGYRSYSDVVISGGTVNAAGGNYSTGIGGSGSTTTLTYIDDVSITSDSYSGTVTLEKPFTDGTNVFEAGVVGDNDTLKDTVLTPSEGIGVRLIGHAVSLGGDIGVNFYMELSDAVIAHKDTAYMRFTIPTGNGTEEQTVTVGDALIKEINNKNYYVFKCGVAAKEMTSQIRAQIIDGDKSGTEYTYSVREYSAYLLEHADERADLAAAVPLVKAMLNYGAYAQIYFDKNTSNLANSVLPDEEKLLDDVTIADPQTSFDLPVGVSYEGVTLSLKSETTLSIYFRSSADLNFSCAGYTVEKAASGGYQIARIRGINAKELNNSLTLTVTAGNESGAVIYSPMNYCHNAVNGGSDDIDLQNVVKALCLYAQEAVRYF